MLALFGGFAAALVLTPLARRVAVRVGNIDDPVGLKVHRRPTPRMGGVAVYLAFAFAALTVLPLDRPVIGLLLGGAAAVVVGICDELLNLPPLLHLAGQIAAAVVAITAGIGVVSSVSNPLTSLATPGVTIPFAIGLPLTIFWLVGMMNTVNFLDGLDGLATGIAALAALMLAVWATEKQSLLVPVTAHHVDLVLPLALAGALVGFLPYNWHVARIFLGDSGAMFVGLALASLSIIGPAKLGTAILVLIIPVLDVAWAIVRRQVRGRSFLSGDKQHVYHRMIALGLSHTSTVLLLYFLCFALATLDLTLHKFQKLVAFLLLAAATGAIFVLLEIRASRQARVVNSKDLSHRLREAQE
jgi:UDP-GlcNAc:undecaprenyl-phosphate GlcNAc-1-phosphate transferase